MQTDLVTLLDISQNKKRACTGYINITSISPRNMIQIQLDSVNKSLL